MFLDWTEVVDKRWFGGGEVQSFSGDGGGECGGDEKGVEEIDKEF